MDGIRLEILRRRTLKSSRSSTAIPAKVPPTLIPTTVPLGRLVLSFVLTLVAAVLIEEVVVSIPEVVVSGSIAEEASVVSRVGVVFAAGSVLEVSVEVTSGASEDIVVGSADTGDATPEVNLGEGVVGMGIIALCVRSVSWNGCCTSKGSGHVLSGSQGSSEQQPR
jgi:hypothetical protein